MSHKDLILLGNGCIGFLLMYVIMRRFGRIYFLSCLALACALGLFDLNMVYPLLN